VVMDEGVHPLPLVVDDEEILRLFAAGLLEEHGFDVMEAENAAAALRVLDSHRDVRLLFTDIQMPGALSGMDLAREVHARWPKRAPSWLLLDKQSRVAPRFRMMAVLSISRMGRRSCSPRSTT
jgi:CheY-like chemotaxis protein